MGLYVTLIGAMSLFDLYCTLQWIALNPYMEANPFMRCLWLCSPNLFALFKISITLLFCIVAFKFKDNKLMRRLIWLPFCIYGVVCFIHLI